jgi:methylated-DNA-[protein]-cysteine S-methyltransferase
LIKRGGAHASLKASGTFVAAKEPWTDVMNTGTEPVGPEHNRQYYCLFDTAIGDCAIAWGERGLTRLQLPEANRAATEQRIRRLTARWGRSTDRLPPAISQVIGELQGYLAGNKTEFLSLILDLTEASEFHRRVYEATRSVGWGKTASYGEIARKVGSPGAARAVGGALARNPVAIIIPCHRVLASGQRLGGFSAHGGTSVKVRLLALEGLRFDGAAPQAGGGLFQTS